MTVYDAQKKYTRKDIMSQFGITSKGGAWFTGHIRYNGEHYIFCNIQSEGRTGQNYNNYFNGDNLIWHTRKKAKLSHGVIADLISNSSPVHIFFRSDNRIPFSYRGVAKALSWSEGDSVQICWSFNEDFLPEEIVNSVLVMEGAKRLVTINAYERDLRARALCIKKWGAICSVCEFNFEQRYGDIGKGYIHVHHLVPISTIGQEYVLDPEHDLRPVCPNCHAMLHRLPNKVLSINELKALLR